MKKCFKKRVPNIAKKSEFEIFLGISPGADVHSD